jgi:acetone carboxylase gamma subunit
VSHPFRENLVVVSDGGETSLCCVACGHRLSAARQDWQAACRKKTFPPTHAGPLMNILDGRYLFEKLYCPACGVLLNAQMVEVKNES